MQAPHTTDFAILFVPTEGLYAEALRRPGLVEALQREHKVMLAGPTTLLATLNSLQMGFRTLALERRSAEVWQVLGAVKTEFGKFGDVLAKTKKKLDEASNTIVQAEVRTRAMERQLRGVESMPATVAPGLLGGIESDSPDDDEAERDAGMSHCRAAQRLPDGHHHAGRPARLHGRDARGSQPRGVEARPSGVGRRRPAQPLRGGADRVVAVGRTPGRSLRLSPPGELGGRHGHVGACCRC